MSGTFNIQRIDDGTCLKEVAAKPMFEVKVDGSKGLTISGILDGVKSVNCTLTRFGHDRSNHASMWCRHLPGQVTGNKWSIKTGRLAKGHYILSIGDQAQGIQCLDLDVFNNDESDLAKPLMSLGINYPFPDHITVVGFCLYGGSYVHCSLTAVDSYGVIRPGTTTSYKNVVATYASPHGWEVTFFPAELGQAVFSDLYAFTAASYEGQVSSTIEV
jgi:hypothetical protein